LDFDTFRRLSWKEVADHTYLTTSSNDYIAIKAIDCISQVTLSSQQSLPVSNQGSLRTTGVMSEA
jgi:hypothetical protein